MQAHFKCKKFQCRTRRQQPGKDHLEGDGQMRMTKNHKFAGFFEKLNMRMSSQDQSFVVGQRKKGKGTELLGGGRAGRRNI